MGTLPVPERLLRRGITDIVRISDSRISGTTFGTIVCHIAPEAAAGGPIAVVESGDIITLDAEKGRLDVSLTNEEIGRRLGILSTRRRPYARGYGALYLDHVLQAPDGADFDFLRNLEGVMSDTVPELLMQGWVSLQ